MVPTKAGSVATVSNLLFTGVIYITEPWISVDGGLNIALFTSYFLAGLLSSSVGRLSKGTVLTLIFGNLLVFGSASLYVYSICRGLGCLLSSLLLIAFIVACTLNIIGILAGQKLNN